MSWRESTQRKLAQRALARQLAYQQSKAQHLRGHEILEAFQPITSDARVIEVGSGAHGLIFYFGAQHGIGVDPLAPSMLLSVCFKGSRCGF